VTQLYPRNKPSSHSYLTHGRSNRIEISRSQLDSSHAFGANKDRVFQVCPRRSSFSSDYHIKKGRWGSPKDTTEGEEQLPVVRHLGRGSYGKMEKDIMV
jgi:hypothetical protein